MSRIFSRPVFIAGATPVTKLTLSVAFDAVTGTQKAVVGTLVLSFVDPLLDCRRKGGDQGSSAWERGGATPP